MIFVGFLVWAACGILALGMLYADVESDRPSKTRKEARKAYWFCLAYGLIGPLGLLMAVLVTGCGASGFRFMPRIAARKGENVEGL